MHKLMEYICDELDEIDRKAGKDGKLSMAEVQYMDTLLHAKKNLLKADEMMGEDDEKESELSYRQGRRSSYRKDGETASYRMGRMNRNSRKNDRVSYRRGGTSYSDDMREVHEMVDSIYDIMDDLPENVKMDAQKFVQKLEQVV